MKVFIVTDIPVLGIDMVVLVMLVFIRFEVIMIQLEVPVVDMLVVDMMLDLNVVGIIVDKIIVVESLVVLKIVMALLGLVILVVENMLGIMLLFFREVVIVIRLSGEVLMMGSILVVSMDIVDCSVLYKVVGVVKYGEECLIEDISGLDCFSDVEDGVWKIVFIIDGEDMEDVIDDINLVALVDVLTGTCDVISGVVIDVVIIVDVVSAVDMSCTDEDKVNTSEIINVMHYLLQNPTIFLYHLDFSQLVHSHIPNGLCTHCESLCGITLHMYTQ